LALIFKVVLSKITMTEDLISASFLAFGATSFESEQLAEPRIKETANMKPVTSILLLLWLCFMPYLV